MRKGYIKEQWTTRNLKIRRVQSDIKIRLPSATSVKSVEEQKTWLTLKIGFAHIQQPIQHDRYSLRVYCVASTAGFTEMTD